MEGQKDVGQTFYHLISNYLRHMGLHQSISDHGVFIWKQEVSEFFLALVTDDCLIIFDDRAQLHDLKSKMGEMLDLTLQEGVILRFLNLRIVQSPAGIRVLLESASIKRTILSRL
jgi:hypothetical protein